MKRIFFVVFFTMALLFCLPDGADSQRRRRGTTRVRPPVQTQTTEAAAETTARGQDARPLTQSEQSRIVERLFSNPRLSSTFRQQRVRALSVKALPVDKDTGAAQAKRLASVIVFNYSQGRASRYLVDAETGELLSEETLRGRPQASAEEKDEAAEIIRRSDELNRLLRENNQLEGGFIVDDPRRGSSSRNRFIQFHILSPDRQRILRLVVVDLTERRVALAGQY
ncbi:MAG TPA: hypothetical protein VF766_03290 [Pyrinomonadaceae bacterium]